MHGSGDRLSLCPFGKADWKLCRMDPDFFRLMVFPRDDITRHRTPSGRGSTYQLSARSLGMSVIHSGYMSWRAKNSRRRRRWACFLARFLASASGSFSASIFTPFPLLPSAPPPTFESKTKVPSFPNLGNLAEDGAASSSRWATFSARLRMWSRKFLRSFRCRARSSRRRRARTSSFDAQDLKPRSEAREEKAAALEVDILKQAWLCFSLSSPLSLSLSFLACGRG
mmetsp:Transcript_12926/g.31682  ORF Transcript_12926/g.31682 Transcript_12926/m.31682 type:complete len:226 (+) Transcript_12926:882-1559(+)